MTKITKRSLWGYSAKSVEEMIGRMQSEHEERCKNLTADLRRFQQMNETIRQEIARVNQELQTVIPQDHLIAKQLCEAHLVQTIVVSQAQKDLLSLIHKNEEAIIATKKPVEEKVKQMLDKIHTLEAQVRSRLQEEEHV